MKTKEFIHQLEKDRLVDAIKEAERGNSGDVVLFISHKKVENAMHEAHAIFHRLKLEKTTPQNSVLIFVAPKSQKLAVIGGTDLHQKLPQEWWTNLVSCVTERFAGGHLTEGLLTALQTIGDVQRQYFPMVTTPDRTGQKDLLEDC
ncbi:MAG: DUF5130 family protein [Chthoniobacterales bacterium]